MSHCLRTEDLILLTRRGGRPAHILGQGLDRPLRLQTRQLSDGSQRLSGRRVRRLCRGEFQN